MKINLLDIPVFYINMAQDVDKNEYMKAKLIELGFKNINRLDAVVETPGIIGLSKSQNKALSQVKAPFIILEDDADPKNFTAEIEVPDDADAVYLGNSPWARMNSHHGFYLKYTKVDGFFETYRIYNMLSSHAILYLTDAYVDICKRTTHYCSYVSQVPMDVPFADIQKYYNVYAFDLPHFIQKEHHSQMSNAPQWTSKRISQHQHEPTDCMEYDKRRFATYKVI